jgi:hypothetical protein
MANGTIAASQLEMLSLSGTGIITITPPATNTNRAITLPDAAGALVVSGTTPSLNGITFPATQVASADANTLDDYEEGTWTPVYSVGDITGTNIVYSGTYTKVGRVVTVNFQANSSTSSNNVVIATYSLFSGLPFSASGIIGNGSVTTEDIDVFARNGFCQTSSSSIVLSKSGASPGTNTIYASLTYFTS